MPIYNDDCFNVFDKLEDDSVDLVLVDLPYGQTNCHWDICIDLEKMWLSLKRIGRHKCQYIFFTTTRFGYDVIKSNPKWFRYDLVWEKHIAVGFLNANKLPLRSHEMIYLFCNSQADKNQKGNKKTYNPQKTSGTPYKRKKDERRQCEIYVKKSILNPSSNITGERFPLSVLKYHQTGAKLHPTQKPLELCEWLIKTYSNEGDIVLDFCMGSGTTIEACLNTNRRYIGVEKDPDIFKTASDRIENVVLNIDETIKNLVINEQRQEDDGGV